MKKQISEIVRIPEDIHCSMHDSKMTFTRDGKSIVRSMAQPGLIVTVHGKEIKLEMHKANKKDTSKIMSMAAHIRNIFNGLGKHYVYELEVCNVHFPMTVKVEKDNLVINNFLGEKQKRIAKILPGAHVEIKGQNILVSSGDIEIAGQTAANIEKATHVAKRDRRVFQDGIFIVRKGGMEE